MLLLGYFVVLSVLVRLAHRRQRTDVEFVLGGRSLNFWLTALSAHASDMSGWLFLGYPALIFGQGLFAAWAGIGLVVGMFLNWHFVAPRLRALTGKLGALTLGAYFEARFQDRSGSVRLISSLMSILFFTCYISSGLLAIGVLSESLLGVSDTVGMIVGLIIVVGYVLSGGYRTVAWLDLFQGCFLLGVILFIPLSLLKGMDSMMQGVALQGLSTTLFPNGGMATLGQIVMIAAGWGLGYFGQPQILTKFMGIAEVAQMSKAKMLGMSWQVLTLGAATVIGLIGIGAFPGGLNDPQQVILVLVRTLFSPFVAGLVLCAIVAATTNVMAAHLLIVASNLSEDLYKRWWRKRAPAGELLFVSRIAVVCVAGMGLFIALLKISSVYQVVLYSWSGLGASFGPLVIASLYFKRVSAWGACAGMLAGGLTAALWPSLGNSVPAIIPAFACSFAGIFLVSRLSPASHFDCRACE